MYGGRDVAEVTSNFGKKTQKTTRNNSDALEKTPPSPWCRGRERRRPPVKRVKIHVKEYVIEAWTKAMTRLVRLLTQWTAA